jgi:hypothetical protein
MEVQLLALKDERAHAILNNVRHNVEEMTKQLG